MQRLEGDRDAVQIMTVHKAKGLEAEVVFLYGGFSAVQDRGVRQYTRRRRSGWPSRADRGHSGSSNSWPPSAPAKISGSSTSR